MKKFDIGERVCWDSGANGNRTRKIGKIVRIVHKDERISPYYSAEAYFPNHRRMFEGLKIPGSGNVAYFVEVSGSGKKKAKLYLPYPKQLKRICEIE